MRCCRRDVSVGIDPGLAKLPKGCYQLVWDWHATNILSITRVSTQPREARSFWEYCCVYVGDTGPSKMVPTLRTNRCLLAQPPIDVERSDCRLRTVRRKLIQIQFPVAISGCTRKPNVDTSKLGTICNHVVKNTGIVGSRDKTVQTGEKTHQPAVMEASPDSDAWTTGLRTETPRQSPRDTMQRPEKNTSVS